MELNNNKVGSSTISIDKIAAPEWNQLATEEKNLLDKAGITPDSSDLSQSVEAIKKIAHSDEIDWVKPDDWVDIRSGALPNSVYFLVGHSTPTESSGTYTVSSFPVFTVVVQITNDTGTYDVFVDGIKVATTNSGQTTTIDWGALYTNKVIVGGWNTTDPYSLVTHVVRVTPTDNTKEITALRLNETTGAQELVHGLLWAHFNTDSYMYLNGCFGSAYKIVCPQLRALTAASTIKFHNSVSRIVRQCTNIEYCAPLETDTTGASVESAFMSCNKLKKLDFINVTDADFGYAFTSCTHLEVVNFYNSYSKTLRNVFGDCSSLKRINNLNISSNLINTVVSPIYGCYQLDNLFLEIPTNNITTLDLHNATNLKGLIVSSNATFTSTNTTQLNVSYTGLDRAALRRLFKSMPTVSNSQVCDITGCTGANSLTPSDIAIATNKGWTVTR